MSRPAIPIPKLKRSQNVAEMVRQRMAEREITGYRMSRIAGVSRQTISNFLNGQAIASDTLLTILANLDLTIVPVEQLGGK